MSDTELKSKTVKELRALAASLGISGAARLRKEELVERLVGAASGVGASGSAEEAAVPPAVAPKRGRGKASPGEAAQDQGADAVSPAATGLAVDSISPAPASISPAPASISPAPASISPATAPITPATPGDQASAAPEAAPGPASLSAPPPSYPGDRLRAMVRDPGTVYVYWEQEERGEEGWEVAALDADGGALDSFRTDRAGTSGYLKVPHGSIGQIQLRRVLPDGATAPAASTWLAAPRSTVSADTTHRWVEVVPGEPAVRSAGPERLVERPAPETPPAPVVATPHVVEDLPWSGDLPHLPSSLQARRDA